MTSVLNPCEEVKTLNLKIACAEHWSDGSSLKVNCAVLPDELLGSELFGSDQVLLLERFISSLRTPTRSRTTHPQDHITMSTCHRRPHGS
jgi:hypothetical protein